MPLTLELEPEHQAELDRIRSERRDRPPSYKTPPSPHPRDRFVEPGPKWATLDALRKNPMAANDPEYDQPGPVDKLDAFAAAVAARFAPGDPVSVATAAEAAGVSPAVAYDCIRRLKARGEAADGWPFAPGVNGRRKAEAAEPVKPATPRRDGRRVGSLRLDGLELASGTDGAAGAPVRDESPERPPRTVVTARPDRIEAGPAVSFPIGGDLASMASRLREAADLIERAATILKGGAA